MKTGSITKKIWAMLLVFAMAFTSVDITAIAQEPAQSDELIAEEAAKQELKDELSGRFDDAELYPGGVFGFYETILDATEGDERVIRIVRQGSTDKEARVTFKAVDISAEYGKDYKLYIEGGMFGNKELPGVEGLRPLMEDYGEISEESDISASLTTDTSEEAADDPESDQDTDRLIVDDADNTSKDMLVEDDTAYTSKDALLDDNTEDAASDTFETGGDEDTDLLNEGDSGDVISDNDVSVTGFSGGSTLANIYSAKTGEAAPEYDWTEYNGGEVPEETKEVMRDGWDESRLALQALDGVTAELIFEPGEYEKDVKIKIKNDSRSESDEVMVFVLQDAEGADIGDSYNGYLNISDDDECEDTSYFVKERNLTVTPDQDKAVVTIVRKSGIDRMDFVSAGTQAVDAVADVNYTKTYEEIFFPAGITERTLEVPILSNRSETTHFWVGVKSASGDVDEDSACLVTIVKDPDNKAEDWEIIETERSDGEEGPDGSTENTGNDAASSANGYEKVIWDYSKENWNSYTIKHTGYYEKIPHSFDISAADYVKLEWNVHGWTKRPWYQRDAYGKYGRVLLADNSNKPIKYADKHEYSGRNDISDTYTDTISRGDSEIWNSSAARFCACCGGTGNNSHSNVTLYAFKIVVGYSKRYTVELMPTYNNMNQYSEKQYKGVVDGKPAFDNGSIVDYPAVSFDDGSVKKVFNPGDTVTVSRAAKGLHANSKGVYATNDTVDFKGFKILKPGGRSELSELIPEKFTIDNKFKVKYKDYIYSDGTIQLVPIYEPKAVKVTFNNDNATKDGKADFRGVYDGFQSNYVLSCSKLDTLHVKAKANPGNGVTFMSIDKPAGAWYQGNKKWTKYISVADNKNQKSASEMITALNYNGGNGWNENKTKVVYSNNLRISTYYDDASIIIAPNPQSENGAKNGNILFVDGIIKGDDPGLGEVIKGGETKRFTNTIIKKPYTFGSVPKAGYHTYWKDGTLDTNGDGQSDAEIPGYKSFYPSYGNSLRYVTQLPVSKLYYNFVTGLDLKGQVEPQPIRGYLKLRDRLLISGEQTERGLNGIQVFCDGEETVTKKGSYAGKEEDGYFELSQGKYYDILSYALTFTGTSDAGDIATLANQNPSIRETIYVDTWEDVNISDVKLFIEQDKKDKSGKEYAPMDITTKKGYYTGLTDGDYNYRLQLTAHRTGVNLSNGTLTFCNPGGDKVVVTGKEDASHNGIYTFDFNPKNLRIQAGATARVAFSDGVTEFLSQDVGVKVRKSLGAINIYNFLLGGNADARVDIIGAVNSAIDMGWKGSFDAGKATGEVYQDEEHNQVIKVGIAFNVVDKKSKDDLFKAAEKAAKAGKEEGKANTEVAKLEGKLSKASDSEKASIEKQLDKAKDEHAKKKDEADKAKAAFDEKMESARKPQKEKPKFGHSFKLDLGFSFLMTFGYDEEDNNWYFKNLMLTATLDSSYSVSVKYATPVGVTLGIGLKLSLNSSATFVVEQRKGLEEDKNYRYYVTEKNKDKFNVLDTDGDDPHRKLDSHGLFSINPSITLSLSAGIAGDLVEVKVSGTAAFNMVFGTTTDSAGSCTLSASIAIKAIVFTFSKELTSKTYPLWGDQDTLKADAISDLCTDTVLHALDEGPGSYLYENADIFEAEDVSYMAAPASWYGNDGQIGKASGPDEGDLSPDMAIDEGGSYCYSESPLADKIGANAAFDAVPLGNGRFAGVLLNVPVNRVNDPENAKAAYYTYYDGNSWSLPQLIEDDGTLDEYPRIYSLEDKGAFIVWSSVNVKYKDTRDKLERQNALDLHGKFVNPDGTLAEGIEEITKTTSDPKGAAMGIEFSDFSADKGTGVFLSGDKLIVSFEKRQYGRGSTTSADPSDDKETTVGDMLYPVSSLLAARAYDLKEKKWAVGSETPDTMPGLSMFDDEIAAERAEAYNENVYGQNFSGYLPKVILHEDIEEPWGYYRAQGSGTTAVKLADPESALLLESDAATYVADGKAYGVIAYTLDADGKMSEPKDLTDEELYIVTYDMEKDTFRDPIILTGQEINTDTGTAYMPVNSNPRFIDTDNGLYLCWLKGDEIVALNTSYLLMNEDKIVKTGTVEGVSYRYVDKSVPPEDAEVFYQAPDHLVTGRSSEMLEGSEGELTGDIHSFDVETDGRYVYIIWPEASDENEGDIGLPDTQMWCVRSTVAGEEESGWLQDTTLPVQITSMSGNHYDDIAFCVFNGKISGLARKVPSRFITVAEARKIHGEAADSEAFVPYAIWDDTEAYPVSFWVNPEGAARIKNAAFTEMDEKMKAGEGAPFSFEVLNDGFETLNGATVTAVDKDGNSVLYGEAGTDENVKKLNIEELLGGGTAGFRGILPLDDDAKSAEVIITVTTADGKSSSITLKEELTPDISVHDLDVESTGTRGRYRVRGVVENIGNARADAGRVILAARKDDTDRKLTQVAYPMLMPGETFDIDTVIDASDEDFTVSCDDLITEELRLYAKYTEDSEEKEVPIYEAIHSYDAEPVYRFIERTAYTEEAERIGYVTQVNVNAVKAVLDDNGTVTGGKVVSSGTGQIILEEGESVDLKVEILNDSPRKDGQALVDSDGNIVATSTGAEGLTYDYEFIGDTAEFDGNGLLKAIEKGSGKLKVYVYPDDRDYDAANVSGPDMRGEVEGIGVMSMSAGDHESTFDEYPDAVIKTYLIDVDIVGRGERIADSGNAYFTDKKGIKYRIISAKEVAVAGVLDKVNDKDVTKVSIPNTVKHDGSTYAVTRIDSNAFRENSRIVRVSMGKNIKAIKYEAFSGCTALNKVSFGSGLEMIGERAFEGCVLLKGLNLPGKIERIEDKAFMNCANITKVTLPATLTYLGGKAFYGCESLKDITIKSEKLDESCLGKDVFMNISALASYKLAMKDKAVKDSMSRLLTDESEIFADRKGIKYKVRSMDSLTVSVVGLTNEAKAKLRSISIPRNVTYKGNKYSVIGIENRAFAQDEMLRSVTIPAYITALGKEAFSGCVGLRTVNIASADLRVGDGAFNGVPDTTVFNYRFKGDDAKLRLSAQLINDETLFTDKNGLKYRVSQSGDSVADLMGSDNAGLDKINVPDTVQYRGVKLQIVTVQDGAFKDNTKIKSVKLGKYVGYIGDGAFAGCSSMTSLKMKTVQYISEEAFSGCSALKSLTLPKDTGCIDREAFKGCVSIKSLTIPAKVRMIDEYAFAGCSSLKSVNIRSKELYEIGLGAFDDISNDVRFTISDKKLHDSYKKLLIDSGVAEGKIK